VRICNEYRYLGTTLNRKETEEQETSNGITKMTSIIAYLNDILRNKSITKKRKFNIYDGKKPDAIFFFNFNLGIIITRCHNMHNI